MAACLLEEAMKPISSLLVVLSVLCLALPAQAEKPEWAGQGGGKGHGKPDKHQNERQNDGQGDRHGDRRGGRDRDDRDGGDRPRHGGRNDGPS